MSCYDWLNSLLLICSHFSLICPSPAARVLDSKHVDFDQRRISDGDVTISPTPPIAAATGSSLGSQSLQRTTHGGHSHTTDDLFFNSGNFNSSSSAAANQIDASVSILRRFLELLSHQLPIVTNAAETLISAYHAAAAVVAASGNEQQLMELSNIMFDSEVKERR